jgi:hypothetical protein
MPFKSIAAPFPVGHTPLFPLRRLDPELPAHVSLWAKAEWYNPSGSVKDRPAWSILRTALSEQRLDELCGILVFTAASFLKLGHSVFFGKRPEALNNTREAPFSALLPMLVALHQDLLHQ